MTKDQAFEQMREALDELSDLVEAALRGEYTPDSFTTQPARSALAAAKAVEPRITQEHFGRSFRKQQPERQPLTDERKEAMAVYAPPFKYQHGYIFDAQQHMVADDDKVEDAVAARIRGWGKLSYLPNGAAIQDELGQMLADALTSYYAAHGITGGQQ